MATLKTKPKKYTIEQLYDMPLSSLIRVAVTDIIHAIDKGYAIDMGDWGHKNGECVGCFAGHCIMANKIVIPKDGKYKYVAKYMSINIYGAAVGDALNMVRFGYLVPAVGELYDDVTQTDENMIREIPASNWSNTEIESPHGFKAFTKDMLRLANKLQAIGF